MITEHQDVFPKKPVRETIFIIFKIILILKTTIIFVSKRIQISHPLYIVFIIWKCLLRTCILRMEALLPQASLNLSHPLGRELACFSWFLIYEHNRDSEILFWAGAWRPMVMAVLINPLLLVVLQRLRFEVRTFFCLTGSFTGERSYFSLV